MLISHRRNPPARADLATQAGCRRSRLIRPSPRGSTTGIS